MSERDVMALLAEANPVRVAELPPFEATLPASVFARRKPQRHLVLAAVVVAAVAASLIGVFVFNGSTPTSSIQGGENLNLAPFGTPTVDHPLPSGAKVSFSDAAAALGVPIALPDTSAVGSPDIGPVWLFSQSGQTMVAVTYPAAKLWIGYQTGQNRYYDDVLLLYEAIAGEDSRSFRVIDVDGVPALAARQNSDQLGTNLGSVMFDAGGARVTVIGHYDQATLQAIAQSIVDRSAAPPAGRLGDVGGVQLFPSLSNARQIAPADASATLGAPVVLPDTSIVNPSDAGQVWAEGSCPASGAANQDGRHACWVWVSFPSAGLTVGYLRPPMYAGTRGEWELQAKHYGDAATVVDLHAVPALAIAPADPYPGSVEFDLAGSRIVVAGDHDVATLQAVAQSIVDRSQPQ